jgi:hypothetical protein
MDPETKRQVIANCRRAAGRVVAKPHKWTPHQVELPYLAGFYFSEASAWDLIADRLEANESFELIELDKPPGALALTMCFEIDPKRAHLYIKIQIGAANRVIGRSFHYSDFK